MQGTLVSVSDNVKKEIEDLYIKDEKLNEYLKKVYLTSTGEVSIIVLNIIVVVQIHYIQVKKY